MRSSCDVVGAGDGAATFVVPEAVGVETALVASGSGFASVEVVEVPLCLRVEVEVEGAGAGAGVCVGVGIGVDVDAAKEVCFSFGFSMGAMLGPNCASSSMQRRARRSSGVRLE